MIECSQCHKQRKRYITVFPDDGRQGEIWCLPCIVGEASRTYIQDEIKAGRRQGKHGEIVLD